MFQVSWPGVVLAGLFVAGAVVAGIFGPSELAMVLAGAAGGTLIPTIGTRPNP
jgi:membrane protein DedA with SNARE-associated domain